MLNALKADFRLMSDGDDWGNLKHWWFTIADEIYFNRPGLTVPASWRFRPSILGETNDPDDYVTTAVREATDDNLMRFGLLLDRYARFLIRAGKDY